MPRQAPLLGSREYQVQHYLETLDPRLNQLRGILTQNCRLSIKGDYTGQQTRETVNYEVEKVITEITPDIQQELKSIKGVAGIIGGKYILRHVVAIRGLMASQSKSRGFDLERIEADLLYSRQHLWNPFTFDDLKFGTKQE